MESVIVRDVSLNFGAIEVLKSLNLTVERGEFLVLLGPSGCGKSTLLNCIAGLLDITDGQIFINGKNVTWEEPKDRGIGMVFQSYALYPQMTVEGNLSFGLKNARMAKDEIARRVARASEILQIEPLLSRKPSEMSGGQRQRVAIGRALVRDVDVFLFDEPLSNLDAKLRSELRVEIKRLHQKLENTMIYVTHDQIEAMTLADRIAVMRGGIIQQLDTPHGIYNRPVNRFVAGFIGSPKMNFLKVSAGDVNAEGVEVTLPGGGRCRVPVNGARLAADAALELGIRPEHLLLDDDGPLAGEIQVIERLGGQTSLYLKMGDDLVTLMADGDVPHWVHERVRFGFAPRRAHLFDGQGLALPSLDRHPLAGLRRRDNRAASDVNGA